MATTKLSLNEVIGTSRQGALYATYDEIVSTLGEPDVIYDGNDDDGKVQVEWRRRGADMVVFTIHDFKEYDTHYTELKEWSVGGFNELAMDSAIDEVLVPVHS